MLKNSELNEVAFCETIFWPTRDIVELQMVLFSYTVFKTHRNKLPKTNKETCLHYSFLPPLVVAKTTCQLIIYTGCSNNSPLFHIPHCFNCLIHFTFLPISSNNNCEVTDYSALCVYIFGLPQNQQNLPNRL